MTGIRRGLILIGLTATIMIGSSIPASADFYASVSAPTTSITTGTVAAPTSVTIKDDCILTTTTVTRTTRTDPATGAVTTTLYSSVSTETDSRTNVQSSTTTSMPGPGPNETTTTTVTGNTDLVVTASWPASGSPGVSGYLVSAHLSDTSTFPIALTDAATRSADARVDADYLSLQPRLSVTTLTTYGWTASTDLSRVLAC